MNDQIMTPESEMFLADISPNRTKARFGEEALLARSHLEACGKWTKFPQALIFGVLALLLLAASLFAPPGIMASLGATMAMASLLAAAYYGLAFDHGQLRQAALFFAQTEQKAARASAEESQNLATAQICLMETTAIERANALLLAGSNLQPVRQYYSGMLETVRADRQLFQTRSAEACKTVEAADREIREAAARFDDRVRRWWFARLVPSYTRGAAFQWLAALEKTAAARFNQAVCAAAIKAYDRFDAFLARLAGECANAQKETAAAAVEATAKLDSARNGQNLTGCNKQFPLPNEIARIVADQIKADEASIRQAIASRPAGQSLADAARRQAMEVAANVKLPKTFEEFFAGLNGAKQLLLQQIDFQSREYASANPYAGRQRIRHRFLLVEGGETSPVAKEVKAISKDMIVRAADHPRPEEFICVTEERFVPIGENPELLEGFRQFHNAPPEKRGAMVVAVEDENFLVAYSPESAHDPSRPARLLFVGLALGIIQRTGAECYKMVDQNDPHAAGFAKGCEQAIDFLAVNDVLARRIEQAVERLQSTEGAAAIRQKLLEAKAKNSVPAAAAKRFRDVLDDEIRRLASIRPALAA